MNPEAEQTLRQLGDSIGYNDAPGIAELERLGYVDTGKSRFAAWARITAAGRAYLYYLSPQVAPGPAKAGTSLSDAVSGMRHTTANQAQRAAVCYTPPADVLDVEATKLDILHAMMRRVLDRMRDG